ncbi:MAG: hypothetical protein BGO07_04085 [Alphaproteobacteria bacterium 40-19]|nr:MAG: hypothetical protein BGO07_04085 [Alphaproteobacteria bacterium 40-19]
MNYLFYFFFLLIVSAFFFSETLFCTQDFLWSLTVLLVVSAAYGLYRSSFLLVFAKNGQKLWRGSFFKPWFKDTTAAEAGLERMILYPLTTIHTPKNTWGCRTVLSNGRCVLLSKFFIGPYTFFYARKKPLSPELSSIHQLFFLYAWPVCMTDKEGIIVFVNQAFGRWLEAPLEKWLGVSFSALFTNGLPQWQELQKKAHIFNSPHFKTKQAWISYIHSLEDVKSELSLFFFFPTHEGAFLPGDLGLLEQLPVPAGLLDMHGFLQQGNCLLKTLVNLSEPQAPSVWMQPLEISCLTEYLKKIRSGLEVLPPLSLHLKEHDKKRFLAFIRPFPSQSKHNSDHFLILLCPFEEESLPCTGKEADPQKLQLLGQLSSGIVHDFNNLLTGIIGFCDLLLQRHQSHQSSKDISQIKQSAMRAARLIQQLLNFSKSTPSCKKVFSLKQCVQNLFPLIRRIIGPKIFLSFQEDGFPGLTYGDVDQVEQILLNLAINARDAMPNGGSLGFRLKHLHVPKPLDVIKHTLISGPYVTLEVRDTGTGIEPHHLEHIFNPFFSTKEPGQGTGLGLASAVQMMKECQGGITVETAMQKGTSFTLFFPHYQGSSATLEKEDSPKEVFSEPIFIKILLVEDEDSIRLFTSRVLQEKGYEVLEAQDGIQAMQLLKKNSDIHLLITDVMMPGIDGPTLALEAKKMNPKIQILFVSGYPEDEVRQRLPMKNVYFLQKPFALADFVKEIQKLFN